MTKYLQPAQVAEQFYTCFNVEGAPKLGGNRASAHLPFCHALQGQLPLMPIAADARGQSFTFQSPWGSSINDVTQFSRKLPTGSMV
jgi:hypothetical protein